MSRTAAVFRGGWRLTHGKRVTLDTAGGFGVGTAPTGDARP